VTSRDLGLLALRVGVGGALVAHGAQKLFGWFGGGGLDQEDELLGTKGMDVAHATPLPTHYAGAATRRGATSAIVYAAVAAPAGKPAGR